MNIDAKELEGVKKLGATKDRINKEHFFARSDWYHWARGYSVVEQALNTIATMMNFMTYNASNVSRNRMPTWPNDIIRRWNE